MAAEEPAAAAVLLAETEALKKRKLRLKRKKARKKMSPLVVSLVEMTAQVTTTNEINLL